eukprot:365903-Chlamydomonas_euryale.AAC.4
MLRTSLEQAASRLAVSCVSSSKIACTVHSRERSQRLCHPRPQRLRRPRPQHCSRQQFRAAIETTEARNERHQLPAPTDCLTLARIIHDKDSRRQLGRNARYRSI